MNKDTIQKALETALKGKGSKKFTQSVEAVFNFRNVDTAKPENRLNLDVVLPKGRGKKVPVVVFAEQQQALDAQKAGAEKVFSNADIQKMAADKKEIRQLAKTCEFIAAPNMMINVGKSLGQVLGAKNRLPRPITGQVADAVKQAEARVRLASRGKYLPTVSCSIGSEAMSVADLAENFDAVYEKVKGKVVESNIASIYVKLSMGPAVRADVSASKEEAANSS
ncbi:50S ribosomal protein L1 [uncultured archaeon]|nr:50S ribosomal protein L1 [uncultured archaeon]